jgi:integrase
VFTGPEGGYLRRSNFARRILKPAATVIGADGLRFHDLRHTHASLLLAAGHPVTEVAARLGHAHPGITLQTYAHAIPGNERAAADAMDALLGDAFEVARGFGGTAAAQTPQATVLPFSR